MVARVNSALRLKGNLPPMFREENTFENMSASFMLDSISCIGLSCNPTKVHYGYETNWALATRALPAAGEAGSGALT